MSSSWRLELFFKSQLQLRDQIALLREGGISRINITNKSKDDQLDSVVQQLREQVKDADICVHYSLKFQSGKSSEKTLASLRDFHTRMPEQGVSILLCSGGGKKKALDSVQAIQHLAEGQDQSKQDAPLYACFNPYLPDPKDRQEERARLTSKLDAGILAGIYLQMGSDLALLESGLKYLQSQTKQKHTALYGSVFIPSKRLLAQQRFRPWSGVFLSDEYLGDVEAARDITKALLRVYKSFGVVPLIETAVRDTKSLREVEELLEHADET